MQDEIDLRPYIVMLLRGWYWIIGLAAVAVIVVLILTSLRPPIYQATAIVLVTDPQYRLEFDPRFDTLERRPAYRLFPTLAMSDRILESVLKAHTPSPESGLETWDLKTIQGIVEATSEGDPSLLLLTVRSRSARDAAAIANAWADALATQGNMIYGVGQTDLTFFQAQAVQARDTLDQADAALVEFEARNRLAVLTARLNALQQAQADYLAAQNKIKTILPDISSLRDQIEAQPAGDPVALADSVTALLLQIKAYNAEGNMPIQLDIQDQSIFLDISPAQQVATLDDVAATLEARVVEIDAQLVELEPILLDLQRQVQALESESDRLYRRQELAQDTFLTLARKLDETRIAAAEEQSILKVGSYAAVPTSPSGSRRLLYLLMGAGLGAMVGAALAIAFGIVGQKQQETA